MNFRKAKVSKAAWLLAPGLGLLGSAITPQRAEMALAEPPHLVTRAATGEDLGQSMATGRCANARRELRFEMLSVTEPYPPPRRNPVVCLAVYRPAQIAR